MSRAVAIPTTAPFSEEDVELLNRVVGAATAVQRAWLAGFLAGVEQAAGAEQVAGITRAAAGSAAEPLTIVYASELEIPRSLPATWPGNRASSASSRR